MKLYVFQISFSPSPSLIPQSFFFFLWDRKLRVLTSSGSFPMSEGGLFKRLQVVDFFLILFFSNCVNKWVRNIFSPLLPHSCEMTSDSFEAHYWAVREISIISLFIESALFSWWRRGRGMGIHSHKPSGPLNPQVTGISVLCANTVRPTSPAQKSFWRVAVIISLSHPV